MPEYVLNTTAAPKVWRELDPFTRGYIEAAMWTLTDGDAGRSRDDLGVVDIALETIEQARVDCEKFQDAFRPDLDAATEERGRDDAMHGHDFWLTRNGHGCGFWDRGYSDNLADRLTEGAHAFGECDWYIGDDGKVYQS